MRRIVLAAAVLAVLMGTAARVNAATIVLQLNLDGDKEIEIEVVDPPATEFDVLSSSWGRLTLNGSQVAFYVFSREDKINAGNLLPTNYPNPWTTLMIRTIGSPTQLLKLEGAARPLNEGGGVIGNVTVATGPFAFLRGATFTLANGGVLTIEF